MTTNTATDNESGPVCENIGPRERAKRLSIGGVLFALGATLVFGLIAGDADRLWRLTAFLLFWAGSISVFQVRERTCIALARKNLRNMDQGNEAITDPEELRQIQAQARRVYLHGSAFAVLLTVAAFALP